MDQHIERGRLKRFKLGDLVTFKTETSQRSAKKYVVVDINNTQIIISDQGKTLTVSPYEIYAQEEYKPLKKQEEESLNKQDMP